MTEYRIPEQYYFRIHHVRPRFKGDIENVLIYMAEKIVAIGAKPTKEFVEKLTDAIYQYPGNQTKKKKTINNWRTEISALFGFIRHQGEVTAPGSRASELAEKQDLVEAFKVFLYNFQYPGNHIKPQECLECVENGIRFKPAQFILKVLKEANKGGGNSLGLTKGEICHCIFNDLRVTRGIESPEETWNRIVYNRRRGYTYDLTGDVIRYAGDIVDYMEIANLLKSYDSNMYYLNTLEEESIIKFIESTEWFDEYDKLIAENRVTFENVKNLTGAWESYVNRDMSDTDFSTDILAYIATDQNELDALKDSVVEDIALQENMVGLEADIQARIEDELDVITTKGIGDIGESLVHGHECMRVKLGGRSDLIHLIKRIPTQFAVGYDISSVELDEKKRYIEVKTTISSKPLRFNQVHLTRNEWNTADTTREAYYIYRLMISKNERKLFLLNDPVGLYKQDKISMIPSDGADITFDPNSVGRYEELLTWQN